MIRLNVKADFAPILRRLKQLPDKVARRAMSRTLNDVMSKAQTQMRREITSEFTLKPERVRELLRLRRANPNELVAVLSARRSGKGRALHLTEFKAKDTRWQTGEIAGHQVRMARRTRTGKLARGKGVQVKVRKGGPWKTLKSAFIAPGKNSRKLIVFERRGKSRKPIDAIVSIDVPQMFNTRRINKRVVDQIRKDAVSTFDRNVRFYLSRQ